MHYVQGSPHKKSYKLRTFVDPQLQPSPPFKKNVLLDNSDALYDQKSVKAGLDN